MRRKKFEKKPLALRTTNVPIMVQLPKPVLRVVFFRTTSGREPVKEWLRSLDRQARMALGEDIKTVQFGWPLGMPLVRPLGHGLWEVRTQLQGEIGRVVFMTMAGKMVLLHGFFKKSRKMQKKDLDLARCRAAQIRRGDSP